MKSLHLTVAQFRRLILVPVILLSLVFSSGIGRASLPTQDVEATALVMIHVADEAALQPLELLGLQIYLRLYSSQGGFSLLLPADPALQEGLSRLGFPPQILDENISGAQYYLLYGLPDDLLQAGSFVNLLVVEGRQAVSRLTSDQLIQLAGLGIKTLPLIPQPLTVNAAQPQTAPATPAVITPYPGVGALMDQVTSASLQTLVGNLSGEWSVVIDGSPYTIQTRYTLSDVPVKKATKYAHDYFLALGLNAGYDYFTYSGLEKRSVIAEQSGVSHPGKIVLLTAHIDDTSIINGNPMTLAPGADDNATGSAAVLLIASILKNHSFDCTLRYALFSGEEQGLYGSRAYAQDVKSRDENVIAVLNLDMLGYNTPGSGKGFELHIQPANAKDQDLANLFHDVVIAHNLNLNPQILDDALSFSDHQAFWEKGYPAILAIEDWDDHTPYYHTTNDRLGSLQMSYYTDFVKAALGTFSYLGCLREGQLSGTVTDSPTAAPIPNATVEARAPTGAIQTVITQPDGSYSLTLVPDTYTLTVSANNYSTVNSGGLQVQAYQVVSQNFSLCQNAGAASFDYSPAFPALGETITFTATAQGGAPPLTYAWNYGDGNLGNGQVVTHAYQSRGAFQVNLSVDNICAVPSLASRPVIVDPELTYLPIVSGIP